MNAGDCSSDAPQVLDSVSTPTSQSSSSSLPPPPSLPLPSTPSPSLPADKTDLQKLINFEFHPLAQLTDPGTDHSTHTDGPVDRFTSDSEHNYGVPSSGIDVAFRSSNLPSPPPPQFFSLETTPAIRYGLGDQQSQVTKTNGYSILPNSTTKRLHLDRIHSNEQDYSCNVRKDPAGRDMRVDPISCSNLNSCTDSHFSRIVTPSPKLPTTPPPAPSSPLLPPLSNERSRTMPMKVDPVCESEELLIDDLEDGKDPIVYKRHEWVRPVVLILFNGDTYSEGVLPTEFSLILPIFVHPTSGVREVTRFYRPPSTHRWKPWEFSIHRVPEPISGSRWRDVMGTPNDQSIRAGSERLV